MKPSVTLELSLSKAVFEQAPIGVTNAKASGGCATLNYTIEDKVKSQSNNNSLQQ